ncbi:glycosyltransferase [Bacteroides sp.]|uniref:glycosyltransferase family 2 protein n=1 Tax=Bacteroides sp. TaxID=29523 RepID=UPI00260F3382|nr:glycosyltransferase [Bacteroides sp.]MDD3036345.1 glycosyltransferase [Bacteroides sp.]
MENHSIEVSVIIPNYNYARFLQRRIESVLSQTYTNFELILLDDASTDDSISVLNNYRDDSRVRHLEVNSKNTGSPFAQWQKGIALSRGKYIWIAESDDAAETLFLEKAIAALNQYPEASFCFLGSHCIDESGDILPTDFDRWGSKQLKNAHHLGVFDGEEYILHNLYWRNYIYNASGVVFRKQCFEQIKDLSCFSMRYSGDWLFWIEMARHGKVIEVYEKLNRFRVHGVSTTKKAQRTGEGIREDMCIVKKIECIAPCIGWQKKSVRHGSFYKEIKRLSVAIDVKQKLYQELNLLFKGVISSYYVERFTKSFSWLIPCLITRDKDRL